MRRTCASQNVFTIQQQNQITPNDTGPDQEFTEASSYEAARAVSVRKFVASRPWRGPKHDPDNLTLLGDFWDDLLHFAEDVFHAIRTGVLEVISVTTDVANGVIEFSLQLASGAAQAVQYVVHTIDDVALAIESAFQRVAAEVEMVINWLKELFSWGDIVNTGRVLVYYIGLHRAASAGGQRLSDAGGQQPAAATDRQAVLQPGVAGERRVRRARGKGFDCRSGAVARIAAAAGRFHRSPQRQPGSHDVRAKAYAELCPEDPPQRRAPYDPATISTFLDTTWSFPSIGLGAGRLGVQPPMDSFAPNAMALTLVLYALFNMVGDYLSVLIPDAEPAGRVVSVISIGLSLGALTWTAPWSQFPKNTSEWSAPMFSMWYFGSSPI